jgi:large subunit ribosomal protein L21
MFAVIKTGGKQYKVSEGDVLKVEKLDKKEGEEFEFDEVLLYQDDKDLKLGKPLIEDAKVKAEVLEHGKGDKKIVFKFKAKKRQSKKGGHRQPYTEIKITKVKA